MADKPFNSFKHSAAQYYLIRIIPYQRINISNPFSYEAKIDIDAFN